MNEETKQFDLIIIGGGISATLLCLSIFKRTKDFNILIIEKSDRFSQKVGESVVDLTAVFLKSLEIDHLLTEQVHKTGVRFLFNETNSSDLGDVAEFASPTLPGAIKGYHLNRSVVDQKLLEEVQQKGVTVYRPAEIVATSFKEFENKLNVRVEDQIKHVQSKWVVDATGRGRFVAKKLNWNNKPIGLNTGAIMAHFQNIAPSAEWDTCKNHYWDGKAVGLRDFI